MTNPDKIRAEALHPDPSTTGLIPLDSLDPHNVEPVEPQAPPYVPEPLFNKKLMLVWAMGAAAVWFTVKFVVPIAVDSARTAVVETVKEVEADGGVRIRIDRDKNGKIFHITPIEAPAVPSPATPVPPSGVAPPPDPAKAPPAKKK